MLVPMQLTFLSWQRGARCASPRFCPARPPRDPKPTRATTKVPTHPLHLRNTSTQTQRQATANNAIAAFFSLFLSVQRTIMPCHVAAAMTCIDMRPPSSARCTWRTEHRHRPIFPRPARRADLFDLAVPHLAPQGREIDPTLFGDARQMIFPRSGGPAWSAMLLPPLRE